MLNEKIVLLTLQLSINSKNFPTILSTKIYFMSKQHLLEGTDIHLAAHQLGLLP